MAGCNQSEQPYQLDPVLVGVVKVLDPSLGRGGEGIGPQSGSGW